MPHWDSTDKMQFYSNLKHFCEGPFKSESSENFGAQTAWFRTLIRTLLLIDKAIRMPSRLDIRAHVLKIDARSQQVTGDREEEEDNFLDNDNSWQPWLTIKFDRKVSDKWNNSLTLECTDVNFSRPIYRFSKKKKNHRFSKTRERYKKWKSGKRTKGTWRNNAVLAQAYQYLNIVNQGEPCGVSQQRRIKLAWESW